MDRREAELLDCIAGLLLQFGTIRMQDHVIEIYPVSAIENAVEILQAGGWIEERTVPAPWPYRSRRERVFLQERWDEAIELMRDQQSNPT